MGIQSNWRQKSIENLEKDNWGDVPKDESSIVQRLMQLRKISLEQFTIDDIRFMAIQESGLMYILPLAIEILSRDLMAEGNYYEGDLLNSLLSIKTEKWLGLDEYWQKVHELIQYDLDTLRQVRPKLMLDHFYLANKIK